MPLDGIKEALRASYRAASSFDTPGMPDVGYDGA